MADILSQPVGITVGGADISVFANNSLIMQDSASFYNNVNAAITNTPVSDSDYGITVSLLSVSIKDSADTVLSALSGATANAPHGVAAAADNTPVSTQKWIG